MGSIYRRVLGVLAGSTQAQLRQQIQYLKAENEILRSRIEGPVRVTPRERARLVKLARPLGVLILTLVSIVQPKTIQRWLREARKARLWRAQPRARAVPIEAWRGAAALPPGGVRTTPSLTR